MDVSIFRKRSWKVRDEHESDQFNTIVECLESVKAEAKGITQDLIDEIDEGLNKLHWARAMAMFSLVILLLIEAFQFTCKLFKKRIRTYFGLQNIMEILIMVASLAFLCLAPTSIEWAGHLGGWILFFGWMNFTAYLCQISSAGRNLYSSIYVSKKILKTFLLFVPSLIGFTCAFHFFLNGNLQFQTFRNAFLKTLIMMLGEYDYEDNFSLNSVDDFGGRNYSLQVPNHT